MGRFLFYSQFSHSIHSSKVLLVDQVGDRSMLPRSAKILLPVLCLQITAQSHKFFDFSLVGQIPLRICNPQLICNLVFCKQKKPISPFFFTLYGKMIKRLVSFLMLFIKHVLGLPLALNFQNWC